MVRQTTLRANVARIGAGMLVSGRAELTNVTFSGNNAFQSGGGLFVSEGNPRATLHHVTIYGNTAVNGTAVARVPGAGYGVSNSIVAGSCVGLGAQFPARNVVTDKTCGGGKIVAEPGLQLLSTAPNGMPVHRLAANSPRA